MKPRYPLITPLQFIFTRSPSLLLTLAPTLAFTIYPVVLIYFEQKKKQMAVKKKEDHLTRLDNIRYTVIRG